MSIYQTFAVGQPLDGFKGRAEGTLFEFDDSGAIMFINFNRPTDSEVAQLKEGAPFEIRFTEIAGEIFVTVKCGTLHWMDAPYSPHLSKEKIETQTEVSDGSGIALQLVLVDVSTGIVKSLRLIGLGTDISRSFLRAVKANLDQPFDRSKYDTAINSVYAKYATSQIADMAPASNRYRIK